MTVSIAELHAIVGGSLRQGAMPPRNGNWSGIGRIVIDSRAVRPGDVFWGIPGRIHNGSHFAEEAFARGASGVVTSGRWVAPWAGCWSLEVADSATALWTLALWKCDRFTGRLITFDGAIGSGTAPAMADAVLSQTRVGQTIGIDRDSKPIDTASALAQLALHNDYALVDFGRSRDFQQFTKTRPSAAHTAVYLHSGRGADLRPDSGAVSPIIDRLRAATANGIPTVVDADDPHLVRAVEKHSKVTLVGRSPHAHISASHVAFSEGHLRFTVDCRQFLVRAQGRHELVAALAAIAIGRTFDLSDAAIAESLRAYQPPRQPRAVESQFTILTVDDLGPAIDSNLQPALDALRELNKRGQRAVLCGDSESSPIGQDAIDVLGELCVTRASADLLIAFGPCSRKLAKAANAAGLPPTHTVECTTAEEAAEAVKTHLLPCDTVVAIGVGTTILDQWRKCSPVNAYQRAA